MFPIAALCGASNSIKCILTPFRFFFHPSIYLSMSHSLEVVGASCQWLMKHMISKALCLQLFWWADESWGWSSLWCYSTMSLQLSLSFYNHLCHPVAWCLQGCLSLWSPDQTKLTVCISPWLTGDHAPLCILISIVYWGENQTITHHALTMTSVHILHYLFQDFVRVS